MGRLAAQAPGACKDLDDGEKARLSEEAIAAIQRLDSVTGSRLVELQVLGALS